MLTREDVEPLIARWTRDLSDQRGYEFTPMLEEFDLGFVVWSKQPSGVMPEPGDGSKTIVDKRTARIHNYPSLPVRTVLAKFREEFEHLPQRRSTIDAHVQFRRDAGRLAAPSIAAHITLTSDRRLRRAFGAKGDQNIDYHRLVREHLDTFGPGYLHRGHIRHAELVLLSDILHEYDDLAHEQGQPAVDLTSARALFHGCHAETFQIRETGDPLGGQRSVPCHTCRTVWIHLGVLNPDAVGTAQPGQRHLITPFTIDEDQAPTAHRVLAQFGRVLGVRLTGIGHEDNQSILAADEIGGVFALDQAGEWFLGNNIEQAVTTLQTGGHQPLVREDGTWEEVA